MEELIDAIENLFWHLAGCMQHMMTPEGRQQFLFYIRSAGVLVFVVSTMKELIALGCIYVLRFFNAPRLVREYGNLRVKASWSAKNNEAIQEIVLPLKIKERIDTIVKVADAASKRCFPLCSVLIHGLPDMFSQPPRSIFNAVLTSTHSRWINNICSALNHRHWEKCGCKGNCTVNTKFAICSNERSRYLSNG